MLTCSVYHCDTDRFTHIERLVVVRTVRHDPTLSLFHGRSDLRVRTMAHPEGDIVR